jgi:hypothetical protein
VTNIRIIREALVSRLMSLGRWFRGRSRRGLKNKIKIDRGQIGEGDGGLTEMNGVDVA